MSFIQTNHKTVNNTFKKELKAMFPTATSIAHKTLDYQRISLIKEGTKVLARVEKSKDLFKGLIIIKNDI